MIRNSRSVCVNKNTVYGLIKKGYLKSIKLGCCKVSVRALAEFIERCEAGEIEPDLCGLPFDTEIRIRTLKGHSFCRRVKNLWAERGQPLKPNST